MPGVGVRTAAVLLLTVGDGTGFPTAAHLASYAGLAPITKPSGTSIHGEHAPRGGNRRLNGAMFLSALACMAGGLQVGGAWSPPSAVPARRGCGPMVYRRPINVPTSGDTRAATSRRPGRPRFARGWVPRA
ncbi:IS110 family transposase [Streptomyces sp. BE303]|uniref:IS110 family transposase n=1 Tax=unclassified Streptomyces TaxID=2593676 RepID=UPI003FA73919